MADGRVLIGLGTGRCGTATLAALLARQPGAIASHELPGARLAWEDGETELDLVLDELARRVAAGAALAAEVGFYYLPYVARIRARFPAARFVVLQREREATVDSFLEKTRSKANHWAPTPRFARHARWNPCFPTYPVELSKRAAVGRYWDEYYAVAAAHASRAPGAFLTLRTEALGTLEAQRGLLDFAGVPRDAQALEPGLTVNRADDGAAPGFWAALRARFSRARRD